MSISSFLKYMYTSPHVCWDKESGGATHDVKTVFTRRGGVFGGGAPPAEASAFCSLIARVSHSNTTQFRPSPIKSSPRSDECPRRSRQQASQKAVDLREGVTDENNE
jgi:hypothetical protein